MFAYDLRFCSPLFWLSRVENLGVVVPCCFSARIQQQPKLWEKWESGGVHYFLHQF